MGFAPNAIEAVVINALFIGLVAAPLFGAGPILTLSVPVLLLTNGALHLVGTIATRRYSPGVITSVVLFFPLGTDAIMAQTISGTGILLGISWMLVPLTIVMLRRLISTQR